MRHSVGITNPSYPDVARRLSISIYPFVIFSEARMRKHSLTGYATEARMRRHCLIGNHATIVQTLVGFSPLRRPRRPGPFPRKVLWRRVVL